MALETAVQGGVHSIDQGRVRQWVLRVVVATAIIGLGLFWLLVKFNGFVVADAMDQAQIARQIASGQGFTTLYARPLVLHMLAGRGRVPQPLPEINQAPLGPLIGAVALRATGMKTQVPESGTISTGDRVIAAAGVFSLIGALLTSLLLGKLLFDARSALLGTGLVICTALVWAFGISGLPQTAMMFLFNTALLCQLAAMRTSEEGQNGKTLLWSGLAAFLLGLVTLGNGIAVCIFGGFLVFAFAALRPRLATAGVCSFAYVLPLLPWLWHNMKSVGQPAGFARFALLRPAGTDRLAFEANFEPALRLSWPDVLANTAKQASDQIADIFGLLGYNPVAMAFFLAVIFHVFGNWRPAQFRWSVLLMWAGAFFGMSLFGVEAQVSVNQLHILFVPVMVFYGLAFLLLLWERLGLTQPLMQTAFVLLLFAIAAAPLVLSFGGRSQRFNWPPYIPMLVQKLGDWIGPQEAMASDIPWATAWYAGRRSLLLPGNPGQFELISSERLLGAPLVAIYLTPESSGGKAYGDIAAGRYRDWARLVMDLTGPQSPPAWRLRSKINLPIDGASLLIADRERWKE